VVRTWAGRELEGWVSTPYPERCKSLNIKLALGGHLKKMAKTSVARVVTVQEAS
jgi:hypothetical protein